jgi:hypothetical protein
MRVRGNREKAIVPDPGIAFASLFSLDHADKTNGQHTADRR